MQLSPYEARKVIELVHCPECGEPAAATAFTWVDKGFYAVVPAWCCDTEDCPNSLEGPDYWTRDLSGFRQNSSANSSD
jgi:hypothetical protein